MPTVASRRDWLGLTSLKHDSCHSAALLESAALGYPPVGPPQSLSNSRHGMTDESVQSVSVERLKVAVRNLADSPDARSLLSEELVWIQYAPRCTPESESGIAIAFDQDGGDHHG
jgi:hypothetical protein